MPVHIERIRRDIENINTFNATPHKGITRLTFSEAYQGALAYIIGQLRKIGAHNTICRGGNLKGRLAGSQPQGPAVMMGSHLDTVVHGGRFDGTTGVVAALEAARVIAEEGIFHRLPIDVVVFAEEEGSRFGWGLLGSSAWAGKFSHSRLNEIKDAEGVSYLEAMELAKLMPGDETILESEHLRAMLEVHIEQGITLEKQGISIGLVEAIVGIKHFEVTIEGRADHAGTTAMAHRFDALQGAVRIIAAVEDIALKSASKTVITAGTVNCEPGQVNVIPGRVKFSLDVRDADASALDSAVAQIQRVVERVCRDRHLIFDVAPKSESAPVSLSSSLIDLMEKMAREKQIKPLRMVSGAGHDAAIMAGLTDTGMIFLPSKDGRSHCPEEFTRMEDIKLGCDILLATVIELAS
jgi:allantoate deiminase